MTSTKFATAIAIAGRIAASRKEPIKHATTCCECGHTGDGEAGQHAGMNSDGECLYRACECKQFKAKGTP